MKWLKRNLYYIFSSWFTQLLLRNRVLHIVALSIKTEMANYRLFGNLAYLLHGVERIWLSLARQWTVVTRQFIYDYHDTCFPQTYHLYILPAHIDTSSYSGLRTPIQGSRWYLLSLLRHGILSAWQSLTISTFFYSIDFIPAKPRRDKKIINYYKKHDSANFVSGTFLATTQLKFVRISSLSCNYYTIPL